MIKIIHNQINKKNKQIFNKNLKIIFICKKNKAGIASGYT